MAAAQGRRGGRVVLALLAAAASASWHSSAGWVSAPSWRGRALRAASARRAGGLADFLSGDSDSAASSREAVASKESKPPVSELKVGATVDGIVADRRKNGVFVDVGCDKLAKVFAPTKRARDTLELKQELKGMTVEVNNERGVQVSVPGLPKLKLLKDLKVGDTLDGRVASRNSNGVYVDIGCESNALVFAPTQQALDTLKPNEELKDMTVEANDEKGVRVSVPSLPKLKLIKDFSVGDKVEGIPRNGRLDIGAQTRAEVNAPTSEWTKVKWRDVLQGVVEAIDLEKSVLTVTIPGLSELVADREAPKPKPKPKPKQKQRQEQTLDVNTIILDGNNLQDAKIQIQLQGGLTYESLSKSGKTITLVKE